MTTENVQGQFEHAAVQPEALKSTDSTEKFVGLEQQASAVVTALVQGADDAGSKVNALGKMYKEFLDAYPGQKGTVDALVADKANQLLQHPEIFGEATFWSTLGGQKNPFFREAVRLMRPKVDLLKASPEFLVKLTRNVRDVEGEKETAAMAAEVFKRLENDATPQADRLRGGATYEVSMAAYKAKNYDKAIAVASDAAEYSRTGADLPGELIAVSNIGGLFLLAKGPDFYADAHAICAGALQRAQAALEGEEFKDTPERKRLSRAAQNIIRHIIDIAKHRGDAATMREQYALLLQNEIIQSEIHEEWVKKVFDDIDAYLEKHQTQVN